MRILAKQNSSSISSKKVQQLAIDNNSKMIGGKFWFCNPFRGMKCSPLVCATLLVAIFSSICLIHHASAIKTSSSPENQPSQQLPPKDSNNFDVQQVAYQSKSGNVPSNHKEISSGSSSSSETTTKQSRRKSRQYDGPIIASSSGNYAAITSDGAYVSQVPVSTNTNYAGSSSSYPAHYSASNYINEISGGGIGSPYHQNAYMHDPLSMVRGYPGEVGVGASTHSLGVPFPGSGIAGMTPLSSMFPAGGSTMFPLMSKGFDVSEIVCTAIAVAIGAVIVGAPFILIYLFVMNQMGANGPNMGPNGGALISLTGPTSSTTVSGRKKRHASLPEALFKQLSPLVNSERVAQTFKSLMHSISKYQN